MEQTYFIISSYLYVKILLYQSSLDIILNTLVDLYFSIYLQVSILGTTCTVVIIGIVMGVSKHSSVFKRSSPIWQLAPPSLTFFS